ncbi:MAG: thymidine phosphorylase [Candidatus Eremiobacteraeota bacterium]|nr:thymidine phosphorylase [Candidatus Eremiobacteraeota bacterium]
MSDFDMRRTIARKRDGAALDDAEWQAVVAGYMSDAIEEAQLAALFMACYFKGIDEPEAAALTRAMVESGETLAPPVANCVDKHSSGGVADTASLIVVPIAAACGIPVAKLSGRALGHTGGTLDKLEAIPGVRTDLSPEAFAEQVRTVGCAVAAQSARLVPADKRMYALRDRTSTVQSLGLVAASIVSKKIAAGAPSIVFDVKVGRGAFFKDLSEVEALSRTMVHIAESFGRRCAAVVTDMNEPLGPAIGTGLEAIEARDFLRNGRRDPRLLALCAILATKMLETAGFAGDAAGAIRHALDSGAAYEMLERMLAAQGAAPGALDALRPHARMLEVRANRSGFVATIDAPKLGLFARALTERFGGTAGVFVHKRIGDAVTAGDVLATVFGGESGEDVLAAYGLADSAPPPRPLVYFEIASEAGGGPEAAAGEPRSRLATR